MEKINVDQLLKEMENVPFGNSAFQNEHFTDGQETPERRYRHALLQLDKKIGALQTCDYRRQRVDLDIEEMNEKLKLANALFLLLDAGREFVKCQRDILRMEIDKAEKEWQLKKEVQLIKDAMVEVETYRAILRDLPKPTRQEFESAELSYWKIRLQRDAACELLQFGTVTVGTQQALTHIGIDVRKRREDGKLVFENHALKQLREGN